MSVHWAVKAVFTALLSAVSLRLGYRIGSQHSTATSVTQKQEAAVLVEEVLEPNEDIPDGDLSSIEAAFMEPCKLVLVVRTDLKMTPGKIATQCGHATLSCYKALVKTNPSLLKHWETTGQAKIALKATSEEQLLELEAIAKSLNLCARSIRDQGPIQVAEDTRTVLGIGPAPVALVNEVTGKLRLL